MGSIRRDLFFNIVLLSVTILVISGAVSTVVLYYSGITAAHETVKHKNIATARFLEGFFKKFYTTIELLSHLEEIRLTPYLGEEARQRVLEIYKLIQQADDDINYIYSGYENGLLLINDYEPPEGYNPVVRPWYKAAVEANPEISEGEPYQEVKTKEWLVSVSKTLSDQEGNITGVLAIDTSLERLVKQLWGLIDRYESSYSYVIREDQTIIIHRDEQYLHKKLSDIIGASFNFAEDSGNFEYRLGDETKIAYYSRIENLGWIVVTAVNKSEIIKPVVVKMGINILVFTVISLTLGWFVSRSIGRKIVKPLVMLKDSVSKIVKADFDTPWTYTYPDNEIGAIAKDITKLTEKELYRKNQQLKAMNQELENISMIDKLTGLFNRHKMDEELKKAFYSWKRYARTFSLLMLDIDGFKKINDTYGHHTGDKVLQELGTLLKHSVRASDVISRWGGEEFLILCPETGKQNAMTVAEKIRSEVENHIFVNDIHVTVSIGVCSVNDSEIMDKLLIVADDRLYKAKRLGKNRVVGQD